VSFKSQVNVSLGWNWNQGAVDNGRLDYAKLFLDGGGNPADGVWNAKDRPLAAESSTTLDLTALQNAILGGTHSINFASIRAMWIINRGEGTLAIGGAAGNEWSAPFGSPGDQIAIPPDSPCLLCNGQSGWPVDAAHRNLKLSANDGDVTYSIVIVGQLATS
jgi:hypothetical protein